MKLAELQSAFQRSILETKDDILAHIPNSPRERKDVLFGVYRNAYVIRLTDFLSGDFERLHTYLGDNVFERLALDFIAAHPSHTPNARWYGQELPEFISGYAPLAHVPIAAALARLEGALNDCFDCADTPVLSRDALLAYAPDDFERLVFAPHASVRRFDTELNLDAIWTALANDQTPPAAEPGASAQAFLVWRHDLAPKYRVLAYEEAMLWDEAARGLPFGAQCEMLATYADPESAPLRAAQYLNTWIAHGLLSTVRLDDRSR